MHRASRYLQSFIAHSFPRTCSTAWATLRESTRSRQRPTTHLSITCLATSPPGFLKSSPSAPNPSMRTGSAGHHRVKRLSTLLSFNGTLAVRLASSLYVSSSHIITTLCVVLTGAAALSNRDRTPGRRLAQLPQPHIPIGQQHLSLHPGCWNLQAEPYYRGLVWSRGTGRQSEHECERGVQLDLQWR